MERLYNDRVFDFNETIDGWKEITEKVLREAKGTLYLVDRDTGESVEAKILFLYSTLIYPGFNCRGIVKIGNDIGNAFVDFTAGNKSVIYKENNNLHDRDLFNDMVRSIVEDLDDDCRYSEALHVQEYSGKNGMKVLVDQYHASQIRNNNPDIPYTDHLYGVSTILISVARMCGEIDKNTLDVMSNAALGHDLFEDTAVDRKVVDCFDKKVYNLICELTNPNDDAHTDEYMLQLSKASEEARIIKYVDLIENTSSFCYSLHEPNITDPVERAKTFYLPILERTTDVLANTEFKKYPKTANEMRNILKVYSDLLVSKIESLV